MGVRLVHHDRSGRIVISVDVPDERSRSKDYLEHALLRYCGWHPNGSRYMAHRQLAPKTNTAHVEACPGSLNMFPAGCLLAALDL